MKKILCLIPFLFCLGVTSVFAENDVTMRVCVTGDKFFSYTRVESFFYAARYYKKVFSLNPIDLSIDFRTCEQTTHHYKQKYTNKIASYINIFSKELSHIKMYVDSSCRTENFELYNEGFDYVDGYVNNGYGKTPVNWGVEYELKTEFGKPIKVSCKLFFE